MISVKSYDKPAWDIGEVFRYARADKSDEAVAGLIRECIAEAEPALSYKVCYTTLDIIRNENYIQLSNIITPSNTLKKALDSCERALVFAATVGTPFDRLIARYSALSPSKALIMQAIGAERTEALCDAFVRDYSAEHRVSLRPRVSAGYGDIELELQRNIFSLLDCPRKIGLTLNASLIMSPSKSVTAIAGIKTAPCASADDSDKNKCYSCPNTGCEFRR